MQQEHWVPTSAKVHENYISRLGDGVLEITASPDDSTDIWQHQGWAINDMVLPADGGLDFAQEIADNDGNVVCDGSKLGISSSAFLSVSASVSANSYFLGTMATSNFTKLMLTHFSL
jgi:hypothetical protein|eukprot:scaffold3835_cov295-Chaetoceros_neogracile.AAC.23